ncbi:hypothetical protein [Granulicella arctica]|uniref:hypothetical protein n=1 Tax=Granulicella arctica TaxID=940613 RepID=UPI0021E03209|nr:hypothetical protein [Granulicella arctica]
MTIDLHRNKTPDSRNYIFSESSFHMHQTVGREFFVKIWGLLLLLSICVSLEGQSSAKELVAKMVANESAAEQHRGHYLYVSKERSDRTGGHLWTERVAETNAGKVRMLIAEDEKPLSTDRASAERARLADIAAHPDVFQKHEQALRNDEHHAKQMLDLLPQAFLFDPPTMEGNFAHIHFRPDPAYSPKSMEERVLHAMSGSVQIDPAIRLHAIEGRMPEDVNIGFGLVATIKAGSNFATTRDRVAGDEWKTAILDTDIDGRAIFFKAIGKKEHAEHSAFKLLPIDMTVPQAVALLEQ